MKPLSRPIATGVWALLTLLMLTTRLKHFGDALHLPDASMAVFFLGGWYLRRHAALAARPPRQHVVKHAFEAGIKAQKGVEL